MAAAFTPARAIRNVAICIAAWAIVATACCTIGSRGQIGWPTSEVLAIRRQPVLLASLVGAALAASGVAYQAILRNPLADPYLLGVSSGASLAAYLWRIAPASLAAGAFASLGPAAAAFVGAMIAVAIVFLLATRRGRLEPITLLLVGVIVNAFCGSLYLLMDTLHRGLAGSGDAASFFVGGLQTTLPPAQEWVAAGIVAVGAIALLSLAGRLNAAVLSDTEATAAGVRIHALRWGALLAASLMAAAAVAVSGPIGFVGLIAPHVARQIVGVDHRRLLPVAAAGGAILLCIADAIGRWLARPELAGQWLPVGVLTALMGAPFFLWLLSSRTRRS